MVCRNEPSFIVKSIIQAEGLCVMVPSLFKCIESNPINAKHILQSQATKQHFNVESLSELQGHYFEPTADKGYACSAHLFEDLKNNVALFIYYCFDGD